MAESYVSRIESLWESGITVDAGTLETILDTALNTMSKWTITIVGDSGVGKTFIPAAVCKKRNIEYIRIMGAGRLPEDIRGFPALVKRVEDLDGKSNEEIYYRTAVSYMTSEPRYQFQLLPEIQRAFEPDFEGMIHIDELGQCSKEVIDVFFQLIYDRRMDDKILSPKALVVASMNPPNLSEYALSRLTKAAEDRLELYKFNPTSSEWCEWAENNEVDPSVISYVLSDPNAYNDNKGRRLHHLSDTIKRYGIENLLDSSNKNLLGALVYSCITSKTAAAYISYIRSQSYLTIRDIITLDNGSSLNKLNKYINGKVGLGMIAKINGSITEISKDASLMERLVIDVKGITDHTDKNLIQYETGKSAEGIMIYLRELSRFKMDIAINLISTIQSGLNTYLKTRLNSFMIDPENASIVKEVVKCTTAGTRTVR